MNWWHRFWRRRQMEEQLEKELRFHLEQHTADLISRGQDPEAARRQARLALAGPEQLKEHCRDARGTRWLEDLLQDIRYALRMLRQKPGFAAVALLTLALGTGATTVMFTVVNSVLLKPLPYPEPDRLVTLMGHTEMSGDQPIAYLDFLDSQRASHSLDMAGWIYSEGTLSQHGEAEHVDEIQVSSGLFSVLGVHLARGRAFHSEEDRPGGAAVMIIGYDLWQSHFAGRAEAVGSTLLFNEKPYAIVGIAPRGFRMFGDDSAVFTPMSQNTERYMQNRRLLPVGVLARLRPGVALNQAQSELGLIGRRLTKQYPETNADRSFVVQQLRPDVEDVRSTLWLLLGAVSLVLLIACVNVASLLLARAISRERELAMRAALGAGRGRLVRQCLTESAVLGLSGGALGILLAAVSLHPFILFWPGSLPRAEEVRLDWRVLLFAVGVSLLSGLFFGLAPALRAPAKELERTLRAGARTITGNSRRLHGLFVVSEVALAIVLLVSAGMLGRTLLHLSSLNPGLNIHNVLIGRMGLSPATLTSPGQIRAAWQDILDRARTVPGVQSITMVDTVPMREGNNPLGYWTSADVPPANKRPIALTTCVTLDYLKVMGMPLLKGRFFNDHDRLGNELVAVVDDVLAQHAFGKENPLGKRLWVPDMGPNPVRVVGVVGHVRHWGLASDDQAKIRAQLYYPFAQVPDPLLRRWSQVMSIAVRTNIPPLNVVKSLRQAVRGAAGDQVIYGVHTMAELVSDSLARQRFLLLLFGIFAGLALLLACIGIYGVLAYLVGQRVPEIGIRMALGASAGEVMWMVLRQSLGMTLLGVGVGAAGALAAGRVLVRLVEGMQPTALPTFVLMILVLVVAALAASFIPARRASRIDPISALRQE
ncbi:MAG TPA: ABC transporter permease [Bryobacteraceae bacterium]|jgi:predicted permease